MSEVFHNWIDLKVDERIQNIVNNVLRFDAQGCEGGADTKAYKWMMKYGLPTIADYGTYEEKVNLHIIFMSVIYVWVIKL